MDISQFQKISKSKIEAGRTIRAVRNDLKEYKEAKQDAYEGLSETYKPIIDVQKRNDEKQDELIKQLQENQKAIKSGLEDVILYQQLPAPEPEPETEPKFKTISDLDKGFRDNIVLNYFDLPQPSELFQMIRDGDEDFNSFNNVLSNLLKKLGGKKGSLTVDREKNKDQINELTNQIETIRGYKRRIAIIPEGLETLGSGSGIYTQKKRNAYKIDQNGQYGGLIIDLPKLYGYLKVIAHKNGPEGLVKVYEKQGDFDTLDLLTKRFNSKKNIQ